MDSFTKSYSEPRRASSVAVRLARLEAFSRRVEAVARAARSAVNSSGLASHAGLLALERAEYYLCRASAEFSKGPSRSVVPGLWLPGRRQVADVRKDSTRTSLIT